MCINVSVWKSMCVCACVSVCVCMYVFVHSLCICMCTCVYIHVCMCLWRCDLWDILKELTQIPYGTKFWWWKILTNLSKFSYSNFSSCISLYVRMIQFIKFFMITICHKFPHWIFAPYSRSILNNIKEGAWWRIRTFSYYVYIRAWANLNIWMFICLDNIHQ